METMKIYLILAAVMMQVSVSAANPLTLVNGLRDDSIVSIYVREYGSVARGDNLLSEELPPGAVISAELPQGHYSILAFDCSGTSYGITPFVHESGEDTVHIELQYVTFDRPNVDLGPFMLPLSSDIPGFAIAEMTLTGDDGSTVRIEDLRIFPNAGVVLWMSPGLYRIEAMDEIGRLYRLDGISVPCDTASIHIRRDMVVRPEEPVGAAGHGSASVLLENCLPNTQIESINMSDETDNILLDLEDLSLDPGCSILLQLEPMEYRLTAVDDRGGIYSADFILEAGDIRLLSLTDAFVLYDFSFHDWGSAP
jgi:hypothetical protein